MVSADGARPAAEPDVDVRPPPSAAAKPETRAAETGGEGAAVTSGPKPGGGHPRFPSEAPASGTPIVDAAAASAPGKRTAKAASSTTVPVPKTEEPAARTAGPDAAAVPVRTAQPPHAAGTPVPAPKAAAAASAPDAAVAAAESADAAAPSKSAPKGAPGKTAKPIVHTKAELEALTAEEPDGGAPDAINYLAVPKNMRRGRPTAPGPGPLPIAGGPVNVAGSEVDFDATRVERFVEEGGVTLDGRTLDADSHAAVANARLEAWMGTRSLHAITDASGRFRFEGLVPGSRITLWITASPTYVQERTEVAVPAQKNKLESDFNLLARAAVPGGHEGGIGVFLGRRGSHTVVTGLVAFGPAERAGLKSGDVIVAVGKRSADALGPGGVEYLLTGPIGSDVELTVQTASEAPRHTTIKRGGR